jgi:hypothetical protein
VKATFEVEITADKSLTVLSNMDVNSEKEKDGKKVTLFNPTPKMSTYVFPPLKLSNISSSHSSWEISDTSKPKLQPASQFASTLLLEWRKTDNSLLTLLLKPSTSSARNSDHLIHFQKWTWSLSPISQPEQWRYPPSTSHLTIELGISYLSYRRFIVRSQNVWSRYQRTCC